MNRFSLKRDLLLVDKFVFSEELLRKTIATGEVFASALDPSGELFRVNVNEIEQLEKAGLLEFYKKLEFVDCESCMEVLQAEQFNKLLTRLVNVENDLSKFILELYQSESKFDDNFTKVLLKSVELSDYYSLFSSYLMNINGSEATPIVHSYNNLCFSDTCNSKVVNVIVNNFPFLDSSMSIEALKEFKSDNDVKHSFLAFKMAIRDLSDDKYCINEIEDKIEYLYVEYSKQLSLHKSKVKYHKLDIIFTSTVGLVEKMLKLEFMDFGRNLISLRKESVNLLLEKRNLPCNEIAYLSRVMDVFDNEKSRIVKG